MGSRGSTRSTATEAPSGGLRPPALWSVRIAGLWILGGAIAKAVTGTPAELPRPILALDVDPLAVITAAVAVETVVGSLAILRPQVGWWPAAGLLALFIAILGGHIAAGGEHCGCFGGALPIPAWLMLAIDAALLVAAVVAAIRGRAVRPSDGAIRGGLTALLATLPLAGALAWLTHERLAGMRPRESQTATAPPAAWSLPTELPEQVLLRPLQWIGKPLAATELGRWTDTSRFPADATALIYYASCNHCAAHLRDLAAKQQADPAKAPTYVLVQLPTPAGYTGRLFVDTLPEAAVHVVLPAEVKAYVITPPWDVTIRGGAVTAAQRIEWPGERKP